MSVNSSHEEGREPGVWLRVRILNSLVLSFRITVRARRDSLREAVQRVTSSTHGNSETQDKRVQDSYSQPYARLSSFLMRRIDRHRAEAARTSGLGPTEAL